MINFEEELNNFEISLEVEDVEDVINNRELTDVTDLLAEALSRRTQER